MSEARGKNKINELETNTLIKPGGWLSVGVLFLFVRYGELACGFLQPMNGIQFRVVA